MKWKNLIWIALFFLGSLNAAGKKHVAPQEEIFALDTEIEDLLDEDLFEDVSTPIEEKKASPLIMKNDLTQMDVDGDEVISLAVESDSALAEDAVMITHPTSIMETIQEETNQSIQKIEINLRKVFAGSPIIYTILFLLSTISICIWLYSMLTIRSIEFLPPQLIRDLRTKLTSNQFDEALNLCVTNKHFFCKMLASGILARKHGLTVMIDTMKSEGKRSTVAFWQRINILNEIAIIAPMLGLLGTVLGMFYAFYDLNRSIESVSLLFDGLGVSVGTTVGGLIVAILAMILYSIVKYRLVKILATVENEVQGFAALIDTRGPNY